MDEAFRKLLGQRGSMASSSTVLERVRKLYGPVSASDIATGMRQQELERVHQQYGNLSTEAASRAMSAFGDVDQFKFMFNTFPVQTEKSILKISVGEKISDLMHTAFEGHNTAILAEQSQRNQVAALNDVSVRYGAVCASLLAFFAAESQACRMDLSQVAKEAGLRHLGLMASADTALGHNIIANFFRVAQASEIGSLAKHATSRDRLSAVAFADSFALESLTSRMGAMEMPWVSISDSVRSVAAFAHVQAIGDIVHSAPPFDLEVAGWLRADLGDWRD